MKKLCLCMAFAMLYFCQVNSQSRDNGDVEITPFIGYSSSFLNGEDSAGPDFRSALKFGANIDYFFNNRWSLRTGLIYDSMGSEIPIFELQLDYVNIPINANWHFGSTRKWNLNFGLTPGFLVKADVNGTDVKDFTESFQLAVSYGIGYKIEVSESFSLLIDAQNLIAVSNHIKESTIKQFNAGSSLNIGAVFKL